MNRAYGNNPFKYFGLGIVSLALTACGGDDTTPDLETPPVTIPTSNLILITDSDGSVKPPEMVASSILELEDEGVATLISNGVDECCGAPSIVDNRVDGVTGAGDGISVVVPESSDGDTYIGLSYFRGNNAPQNEGSMTILIDDVVVGNLIPVINSDDWATLIRLFLSSSNFNKRLLTSFLWLVVWKIW